MSKNATKDYTTDNLIFDEKALRGSWDSYLVRLILKGVTLTNEVLLRSVFY